MGSFSYIGWLALPVLVVAAMPVESAPPSLPEALILETCTPELSVSCEEKRVEKAIELNLDGYARMRGKELKDRMKGRLDREQDRRNALEKAARQGAEVVVMWPTEIVKGGTTIVKVDRETGGNVYHWGQSFTSRGAIGMDMYRRDPDRAYTEGLHSCIPSMDHSRIWERGTPCPAGKIKEFLDRGADVNSLDFFDHPLLYKLGGLLEVGSEKPLELYVADDLLTIGRMLLEAGADANATPPPTAYREDWATRRGLGRKGEPWPSLLRRVRTALSSRIENEGNRVLGAEDYRAAREELIRMGLADYRQEATPDQRAAVTQTLLSEFEKLLVAHGARG